MNKGTVKFYNETKGFGFIKDKIQRKNITLTSARQKIKLRKMIL